MTIYELLFTRTNNRQTIVDGFCFAVAGFLARLNAGYDDYELRGIVGEWTQEEERAEIAASLAANEKARREGVARSGIWGG